VVDDRSEVSAMSPGPTVWKTKIHSLREDFLGDDQRDQARAYCRQAGVVGIGWGRWTLKVPDGAPLEDVLAEIGGIEGWSPGGHRSAAGPGREVR
jgi:hypothetical protein